MLKIYEYCGQIHQELFNEWFAARGYPAPNPQFLPRAGAVVYYEDTPVCGGFLISTDTNGAVMAHLISDPKVSGDIRNTCLDFMIDNFIMSARKAGFKQLCCATNLEGLKTRFESHGFKKADEDITHYGRDL